MFTLLWGGVLSALRVLALNRNFGGAFTVYDIKGIAGLCFGFSAAVVALAYFGAIED